MRMKLLGLCLPLTLCAQDPAAVQRALQGLHREGALDLTLSAEVRLSLQGEKGSETHGEANVGLRLRRDGSGLAAQWRQEDLAASQAEAHAHDEDPARATPVRELMGELEPARLDHLVHQEAALLGILNRARLAGSEAAQIEGRAARRLEFDYTPRVPGRLRRRMKEAKGRLQLWVDADGRPLRSEVTEHWAGRAGRIAPLETGDHAVTTRYALVEGWLVAGERTTEDRRDDYYTRSATHLHILLRP